MVDVLARGKSTCSNHHRQSVERTPETTPRMQRETQEIQEVIRRLKQP